MLALAVSASVASKSEKLRPLETLRIKIELAKHLVRAMQELNIVKVEIYLDISARLQEISRMANGWIKYVIQTAQKEQ